MMIKMMNRMIKLMMLTSSMNLYDLPPPRLKREPVLAHHEAEHHQGEDLARVGLINDDHDDHDEEGGHVDDDDVDVDENLG